MGRVTYALLYVLCGGALAYFAYEVLTAPPTHIDDAYMFVRYAGNILRHDGYTWNPGDPPTYGCTSIPYAYLIAGLRYALPLASSSKVLRIASGIAGGLALLLMALAGSLHGRSELMKTPAVVGALLFPVLLLGDAYVFHSASGMDTTLSLLANAALLCTLALLARRPTRRNAILVAGAAYFTFLVRPDNAFYMLVLPALYLFFAAPEARRRFPLVFATLVALLAVDLAAKWYAFGDFVPLSYYVKRSGFYEAYLGATKWNPLAYLAEFLLQSSPLWVTLLVFGDRRVRPLALTLLFPLTLTFSYYFDVVQIVGLRSRFYFPSLPFLAVLYVVSLDRVALRGLGYLTARSAALRGVAVASMFGLLFFGRGALADAYARTFLENREGLAYQLPSTERTFPQLGWWRSIEVMASITRRLPPGTTIAASEHGFVAATNPDVRIVDLVGLHDSRMARTGFTTEWLAEETPALIWLPHTDYAKIRYEIYLDPTFRSDYSLFPSGLDYGLAVRRDRPDVLEIVARTFRRVYGVSSLEGFESSPDGFELSSTPPSEPPYGDRASHRSPGRGARAHAAR